MIEEVFDVLLEASQKLFQFLSTFYIFGTVSLLHFLIFFAIVGMIVNVFVGRGKE